MGSTLGLGLYVLAGNVASQKAGPAVLISFAFAALASGFSALCYAEFAGLVPKAGSAYVYSYITVGEFAAFFIGWNLILEYAIGAAAVTRGFSDHLRTLYEHLTTSTTIINNDNTNKTAISTSQHDNLATNEPADLLRNNFTPTTMRDHYADSTMGGIHFDALPFLIVAIISIPLAIGVKCSTRVTFLFTIINLMVVVCVIGSGLIVIDGFKNWQLSAAEVNGCGGGGFMPYGWAGVFAGASTCFFGFIGFDTIASSAEEARNPKRNVPISIILSLFISSLAYMSIASVQTLLWPYYDQRRDSVLPYMFKQLNMPVTYWIVTIGALAGLASSQLAGMIPLPRTLYSMASDRLIYSYLSKISERFKIPLRAVIIGSLLVAPLAATVETDTLADMVSIGTLAAYSLVSLSVLILRYEKHDCSRTLEDKRPNSQNNNHLNFAEIFSALDAATREPQQVPYKQRTLGFTMNGQSTLTNGSITTTTTNDDMTNQQQQTNFGGDPGVQNLNGLKRKILAPQLSGRAGFEPWFEATSVANNNDNNCSQLQRIESGPNTINSQFDKSITNTITIKGDDSNENSKGPSSWANFYHLLTMSSDISKDTNDNNSNNNNNYYYNNNIAPNDQTSQLSKILIILLVLLSACLDFVAYLWINNKAGDQYGTNFVTTGMCIIIVFIIVMMLILSRLPTTQRMDTDSFRVPMVPLIPMLSIIVNIYLMLSLDIKVWIRFAIWMAIGFFIYFSYGIWKSIGYLVGNITDLH